MSPPSKSSPGELLIHNQPVATAFLSEQQDVELSALPPPGGTLVLRIGTGTEALAPFLRPGDPAWYWRWHSRNTVGRVPVRLDLLWPDGSTETRHATLEIHPRKIDQERYALLLEHLQESAVALLLRLGGAYAGSLPVHADLEQTLIEQYATLFGEPFAVLEQAVLRIARRPHTLLRSHLERVESGQARDFSNLAPSLLDLPRADDALPATLLERRAEETADVYEQRLLKRLLQELSRRAGFMQTVAATARSETLGGLVAELQTIKERLRILQAQPFLTDVQPLTQFHGPSHLMQRDPNYRQVYRSWQALRQHPLVELDNPLLHIPLHELPYLYECWCTLQLARALLELPGITVQEQHLIMPQNAAGTAQHTSTDLSDTPVFAFGLSKETPLLVLNYRGMRLTLLYQRAYKAQNAQRKAHSAASRIPQPVLVSLDCHTRVPDIVIEIAQAGTGPTVLVFDAKYRLDTRGDVPEDAMADAYSYLGSIGTLDSHRAVQTVILCYPGQGEAQVYPSNVGVLPLLPGNTAELAELLARWLDSKGERKK